MDNTDKYTYRLIKIQQIYENDDITYRFNDMETNKCVIFKSISDNSILTEVPESILNVIEEIMNNANTFVNCVVIKAEYSENSNYIDCFLDEEFGCFIFPNSYAIYLENINSIEKFIFKDLQSDKKIKLILPEDRSGETALRYINVILSNLIKSNELFNYYGKQAIKHFIIFGEVENIDSEYINIRVNNKFIFETFDTFYYQNFIFEDEDYEDDYNEDYDDDDFEDYEE